MTLVNLDQALRDILERMNTGSCDCQGGYLYEDVIEAMRRAYRMAEGKEVLGRFVGEPAVPALKEEGDVTRT